MKSKNDISPSVLRRLLNYDPLTGILTWKTRGVEWFAAGKYSAQRVCDTWNAKHAGKEAGSYAAGYIGVSLLGRTHKGHRIAWAIHHGEWPKADIDHENGVRSDNRLNNLRDVNRLGNTKNRKLHRNNKSGYFGVKFSKKTGKWEVQIGGKKRVFLGYFSDLNEAISVRKAAEKEHGYHANHGRI